MLRATGVRVENHWRSRREPLAFALRATSVRVESHWYSRREPLAFALRATADGFPGRVRAPRRTSRGWHCLRIKTDTVSSRRSIVHDSCVASRRSSFCFPDEGLLQGTTGSARALRGKGKEEERAIEYKGKRRGRNEN